MKFNQTYRKKDDIELISEANKKGRFFCFKSKAPEVAENDEGEAEEGEGEEGEYEKVEGVEGEEVEEKKEDG